MFKTKKIYKRSIIESLIKNIIIVILTFLSYKIIFSNLLSIESLQVGDFLLTISILLVTVCFANFAFSYEYSNMTSVGVRLLSHLATFIFMFLIALLLESMVITLKIVYPSMFSMMAVFSVLLYVGVALYDFWDLLRVFRQ